MGATKPVTDETFEAEVLQSRTVLVDYWAERHGPSEMIAPILEATAEEHGDKFDIAKLNVRGQGLPRAGHADRQAGLPGRQRAPAGHAGLVHRRGQQPGVQHGQGNGEGTRAGP